MKTSESLDKIAPALTKAQSEMGGAVKESKNPFFKSKYADLTSVWKACKEALHSNGFSVIQSPIYSDGRIGVSTMLLHASGQFISDEYTLSVKKQNDPQADGSSITYARRYALAAFVGVCPVDDDGEMAMARNQKKQQPTKQPQQKKKQPAPETFLDQMKWYAIHESKIYKKVLDSWQIDSAKKITNEDSQVKIIEQIEGEIK